jgi:hypothetical protein
MKLNLPFLFLASLPRLGGGWIANKSRAPMRVVKWVVIFPPGFFGCGVHRAAGRCGDAKKLSSFPCALASWRLCVEECFTLSLTPALSPRRGSSRRPSSDCSVTFLPTPAHDLPMSRRTIHPLLGGEGRGEGERLNHLRLESIRDRHAVGFFWRQTGGIL